MKPGSSGLGTVTGRADSREGRALAAPGGCRVHTFIHLQVTKRCWSNGRYTHDGAERVHPELALRQWRISGNGYLNLGNSYDGMNYGANLAPA